MPSVPRLSGKAFTSTVSPALISQAGAQWLTSHFPCGLQDDTAEFRGGSFIGLFFGLESRDLKSLPTDAKEVGKSGEEPHMFFF